MKNAIHIIVLAMLSMGMMACGGQSASPDQQNTETPTITIEFSASPAIILANEMATLFWSVDGASSCTIPGVFFSGGGKAKGGAAFFSSLSKETPLPDLGGEGQELAVLPSAGDTEVAPTESTIYTITCTNEEGLSQSATTEIIFSLDADEDGYPDTLEILVGTKTNDPDSDDDGILDGQEDLNRNGLVDGNETDPTNPASRNPYYCDSIRHDNEGDGLDVLSTCINPEKLAAGDRHACLIMDNGLMRCWGRNNFFQLGTSGEDIGDDETAAEGGTFSGLIQVSAGGATTCALRHSGSVLCWGRGHNGVTGQGHTNLQTFAQARVNLPEPSIQVSTSGNHTCAVSVTGSLYCWGNNEFGQLGYGNKDDIGDNEHPDSVGPVDIGAPVKQVSTGNGVTCALLVSGQVKCWGASNAIGWEVDYAQYEAYPGDQEGETPAEFPFVSLNAGSAYEISSGHNHTCAMSVGAMDCWGAGGSGQLGHGNTETLGDDELASAFGPVPYGGGDITNIATGGAGTCVSLADGNAKCWGASAFGIGYGNTDTIGDDEPASAGGNLDFDEKRSVYIASGGGFSCALMRDQTVYCWGNNDVGQLGLGNTTPVSNSVLGEVDYR